MGTYAGVGDGDGAGGAVGGAFGGSGSSKNPVSYSGISCTTENKKRGGFSDLLDDNNFDTQENSFVTETLSLPLLQDLKTINIFCQIH